LDEDKNGRFHVVAPTPTSFT